MITGKDAPRYCLVTDLSDGGVRVNAVGYKVPDEFELKLRFDFVEMKLHGFAAVGRQHEGGDEPALRPPPQCVQECPTGPLRAAVFGAVMVSSPASL